MLLGSEVSSPDELPPKEELGCGTLGLLPVPILDAGDVSSVLLGSEVSSLDELLPKEELETGAELLGDIGISVGVVLSILVFD
jgi:hypothetical protein